MSTKTPSKLAAILAVALFGSGATLAAAAPVTSPQAPHEAVVTIPSGDHVVDKAGHEPMQVLIFIHRAHLPVGGAVPGAQR